MTGLLDGGLAAIFAAAFAPIYMDGTLHRRPEYDADDEGTITRVSKEDWPTEDVKVQLDAATQAMRQAEGYADTDQRILILASGLTAPTTDDEITAGGVRWAIASVSQDPARTYFELRGQRA